MTSLDSFTSFVPVDLVAAMVAEQLESPAQVRAVVDEFAASFRGMVDAGRERRPDVTSWPDTVAFLHSDPSAPMVGPTLALDDVARAVVLVTLQSLGVCNHGAHAVYPERGTVQYVAGLFGGAA